MILLSLINFIAAFLLFQLELIVAKWMLPAYGGSYAVWGACVVFFQATLLLGYIFVHWMSENFRYKKYSYWHLYFILLFIPLLGFPGHALSIQPPQHSVFLVADIFVRLLTSIGPVFFILSTISVFSQRWLVSSPLGVREQPYRLYAYSNLGSFAALLTYPFFFEYYLDLNTQQLIWRWTYFIFIALNLGAALLIPFRESRKREKEKENVSRRDVQLWFILGMAGSMLFLSVTNILSYEIAPIPLLWIVPLSIYLLSFVLTFKRNSWYPSWISSFLPVTVGLGSLLFFFLRQQTFPKVIEIAVLYTILFVLCMYCQGQLSIHKPRTKNGLTLFYVIISAGSFAGGLLVSWVIPAISSFLIEFQLALFLVVLAFIVAQNKEEREKIRKQDMLYVVVVIFSLAVWPQLFKHHNIWATVCFTFLICAIFAYLKSRPRLLVTLAVSIIVLTPFLEPFWTEQMYIKRLRNYYGTYEVVDKGEARVLNHGQILHGMQYIDPAKGSHPLAYYSVSSPIGEILQKSSFKTADVAALGLGVGTLAVYTKPHQGMDFFELDPDVYKLAKTYFSYLDRAEGRLRFFFGDARLGLNKENIRYDLIVADAFSGDSIPFHLLTVEMMEEYRKHLTEKGAVVFHISNRYFDLVPVLTNIASEVKARSCFKFAPGRDVFLASDWFAMTWDDETYSTLVSELGWEERTVSKVGFQRPWTDQYSSILKSIKIKDLLKQVTEFNYFSMSE